MLSELRAERQLLAIEAASVPHMKQDARASLISRYARRASGAPRTRSVGEALAQAGIPVRVGRRADSPVATPEAPGE